MFLCEGVCEITSRILPGPGPGRFGHLLPNELLSAKYFGWMFALNRPFEFCVRMDSSLDIRFRPTYFQTSIGPPKVFWTETILMSFGILRADRRAESIRNSGLVVWNMRASSPGLLRQNGRLLAPMAMHVPFENLQLA